MASLLAVRFAARGALPRLAVFVPRMGMATKKGPLSDADLAAYKRDGYVKSTTFLSPEERKQIVQWTNEVQSWPETAGKWMQYFEEVDGKKTLCRVENYIDYHPELKKFLLGKLTEACAQLLEEPAILFKEKINFKLPGGDGFKPHQDAPAWTTFGQTKHMTALVAADKAFKENGCMEMVPGHFDKMLPHPNGELDPAQVEKWKWVSVPCEIGDVVFFSNFVPHRSFRNTTNQSRRAHYVTYGVEREGDHRLSYYEDKRDKFPPEIERIPGKDYSEGGKIYNLANPIATSKIKTE